MKKLNSVNQQKLLIGLLIFSGLASVAGGIGLITGKAGVPSVWLASTGFNSYYFPGVILMAIVGGSALLAAISLYKKQVGAGIATVLAGLIMLVWIIGEIASIRHINFLQLVFIVIAISIIALAPSDKTKS